MGALIRLLAESSGLRVPFEPVGRFYGDRGGQGGAATQQSDRVSQSSLTHRPSDECEREEADLERSSAVAVVYSRLFLVCVHSFQPSLKL